MSDALTCIVNKQFNIKRKEQV